MREIYVSTADRSAVQSVANGNLRANCVPRLTFCFNLGLVCTQKPLCIKGYGQFNFFRSRVAAFWRRRQKGETFVDTIRDNWSKTVGEALSGKGFGGCATKVYKSNKCCTLLV